MNARRGSDTVTNLDLLDLITEDVLDDFTELLVSLLGLFLLGLLVLILRQLKTLLGHTDQLVSVEFLELLDAVLINRLSHEENLEATLLEDLKEGGSLHRLSAFTSDVVDVLLVLLHVVNVLTKGDHLLTRLGGVVTEELSKLLTVGRVLVDTELEVLAEGLVELLPVILVLSNLVEELDALLDEVLADHLHDTVLLKSFTRNVERKILGINNTLDEAQPFRDQLLTVVHDEHTAHIELDVVVLLALEHIEGSTLGHIEDGSETKLTFEREVLDSQVLLPIVGERFVEFGVFLLGAH